MCLAFRDQGQRENLLTQAKATGCMTPPQVKVDGEGGYMEPWRRGNRAQCRLSFS